MTSDSETQHHLPTKSDTFAMVGETHGALQLDSKIMANSSSDEEIAV